MRLLGSTKKSVDKDKDGKNVPKLESVEVFLGHCNLVKNDYRHTSKVLYTFVPNKQFHKYFMTMNTVNSEYFSVEIWFTDQANKALDIILR